MNEPKYHISFLNHLSLHKMGILVDGMHDCLKDYKD